MRKGRPIKEENKEKTEGVKKGKRKKLKKKKIREREREA